jgi:hypothetical protein
MSNPAYSGVRDNSWRYLAPFFLLICLFLLLVYTVVGGGIPLGGNSGNNNKGSSGGINHHGGGIGNGIDNNNGGTRPPVPEVVCAVGQDKYVVKKGDTCWDVAKRYGMSVQQLESMNNEADCERLDVGMRLCVKGAGDHSGDRD